MDLVDEEQVFIMGNMYITTVMIYCFLSITGTNLSQNMSLVEAVALWTNSCLMRVQGISIPESTQGS
jgi:hypothetical protein